MGHAATEVTFTASILKKHKDLPRYVALPREVMLDLVGGFTAAVRFNGGPACRRHARPWGKGSNARFFGLAEDQCRRDGVDTGDTVLFSIRQVDEVPPEFARAIANSPAAAEAWAAMPASHRRNRCDHIAGAKGAETVARRIERAIATLERGRPGSA